MTDAVLRGPDVSAYQGTQIDWGAVRADGASFAFAKATEGIGVQDAAFAANWAGIRAAGLLRGCYAFARPEWNDPLHEAAWFLSVVPALQTYDMAVLDIETGPADGGDVSAWALTWLGHVQDVLGAAPLLYTFQFFAEQRLKDAALARYPLWCAAYQSECPPKVGVWDSVTLWQRTDKASYAGIPGAVDESVLARDMNGMRALGKRAAPRKIWVATDMMLRSAPDASHVYWPVQLVYKGATLDVVGAEENGWICVRAGSRTGWILASNTKTL